MIFITEKKANELFKQYLDAERRGDDKLASDIEAELKEGNWYITGSGTGGMRLEKRERNLNLNAFDTDYMPNETNSRPYVGDEPKKNNGWVIFGVTASIIALVILTIYLIKRFKNATPA